MEELYIHNTTEGTKAAEERDTTIRQGILTEWQQRWKGGSTNSSGWGDITEKSISS